MRPENQVNLGVVQVHKRVIADIASAAVADVEGVRMSRNKTLESALSFVGIRHNSAVDVHVKNGDQVSVVIKVVVRFGMDLSDVSRRVQDVVMTAVEKMAEVDLRDVDVSIQGIERG